MSDTIELTPPRNVFDLTGTYVKQVREHFKLGREQFQRAAGLEGKSAARIYNIETKDSWKPGDRELVFEFVTRLLADPDATLASLPTRGKRSASATTTAVASGAEDDDAGGDVANAADGANLPETSDAEPSMLTPELLDLEANGDWIAWAERETGVSGYSFEHDAAHGTVVDLPTPQRVQLPPVPEGGVRVSNGQLQTFARCPRKWWLGWIRKLALRRDDPTSVRSTGTRVHRALAAYYAPPGQPTVDPRDALERIIVDDWTLIRNEVYEVAAGEGEAELRLSEVANDFNAAVALERAMIEGYVEWLTETGADSELEVVTAEAPQAALLEVDGMPPIQLVSLTDTRVRRKTDGALLFIDHKTVGDFKAPVALMPMNRQMLHYHLVEFLNTPRGEARCGGALYNMLRRVKRTGAAKPPFFERVESRHSDVELDVYRRQTVGTVSRMLAAQAALAGGADHQQVVPPTVQDDCRWSCDFFAICHMFDDGSHVEPLIDNLYRVVNPWSRYDGLDIENGEITG